MYLQIRTVSALPLPMGVRFHATAPKCESGRQEFGFLRARQTPRCCVRFVRQSHGKTADPGTGRLNFDKIPQSKRRLEVTARALHHLPAGHQPEHRLGDSRPAGSREEINAAPRGNAPSDELAPDGRLPGTAAPTLGTRGQER
jgi:hypothetical protein